MNRKKPEQRETFICPNCGAEVPTGSLSCPECGSDEETGWSEDADVWSADTSTGYAEDDEFDYDKFVAQEFEGKNRKIIGLPVWAFYLLLGILLVSLVILILYFV